MLDYSLDLIKIREVYEKVYRRNNFSFKINNKQYTQNVICVKFSYVHKLYNKLIIKSDGMNKTYYIRSGYEYHYEKYKDGVDIELDENSKPVLAGIEIGVEIENVIKNTDLLQDYFEYSCGKYQLTTTPIPVIQSKSELREYLYSNGFYCDGIKFVRFKRSSGSSRVGKCLFVNELLYNKMSKWDMCGLKIKENDPIDLAALESYISLPSSSIIDTLEINPQNFLLIDDYDSCFKDTVVSVKYENGKLIANECEEQITNSIFDGQSLLDYTLFEKYPDKGMMLLRNRFFKSACFNTNIQKWFSDNNITDISQLNGKTIATDIKDIKIITTPSSIKYLKFGTFNQWLKNLDTTFGIVKSEKPTYYFNGRMVQCHYQLINTLELSNDDVKKLIQPHLDYISLIRNDPDVLRYHIKYPYEEMLEQNITPLYSKNEIVFKLLGMNDKFSKTKMYYDFRNDLIRSMIKNIRRGHILISGNYSVLFGNGIEMLQQATGMFNGNSILGVGNVSCKHFEYNKTVLGSRSPHINSGNVYLANNIKNKLIDKYFNLSEQIVNVNSINENIQQRLNGAD